MFDAMTVKHPITHRVADLQVLYPVVPLVTVGPFADFVLHVPEVGVTGILAYLTNALITFPDLLPLNPYVLA